MCNEFEWGIQMCDACWQITELNNGLIWFMLKTLSIPMLFEWREERADVLPSVTPLSPQWESTPRNMGLTAHCGWRCDPFISLLAFTLLCCGVELCPTWEFLHHLDMELWNYVPFQQFTKLTWPKLTWAREWYSKAESWRLLWRERVESSLVEAGIPVPSLLQHATRPGRLGLDGWEGQLQFY